jgi:hypothetical protein
MKKQILIVTAAALTAAVVIFNGTSAATAQQTPQYQVGGFPITSLQMSVLQPSVKINEQQRLSRQRTMNASRVPCIPILVSPIRATKRGGPTSDAHHLSQKCSRACPLWVIGGHSGPNDVCFTPESGHSRSASDL